jgi:hypothetical protein
MVEENRFDSSAGDSMVAIAACILRERLDICVDRVPRRFNAGPEFASVR